MTYLDKNYTKPSQKSPLLQRDLADEIAKSNHLYDDHKLVSHFLHHYDSTNHKVIRNVSDVEICMSTDPAIQAYTTREYRENLKLGLLNQQRSPQSRQLDDDMLIANGAIPSNLERDEIVSCTRKGLERMDDVLSRVIACADTASTDSPDDSLNSE